MTTYEKQSEFINNLLNTPIDDIYDKEVVEHFGVKGMRWGVRNSDKSLAKEDKKFAKKANRTDNVIAMYREAAARTRNELPSINKQWGNADLSDPKTNQRYQESVLGILRKNLYEVAAEQISPSGTKRLELTISDSGRFKVRTVDLVQSASLTDIDLIVEKDEFGYITNIEFPDELFISHTDLLVKDFIEHVGVRGMRWGVRKSRSAIYAAKASRKEKKALSGKANVKKMSDQEIRSVINRIKMEQEYIKLTTKPSLKSKGASLAGKIITEVGTTSAKKIAESYSAPLVAKLMADKAKKGSVGKIISKNFPTGQPNPGGYI